MWVIKLWVGQICSCIYSKIQDLFYIQHLLSSTEIIVTFINKTISILANFINFQKHLRLQHKCKTKYHSDYICNVKKEVFYLMTHNTF